MQAQPRLSEEKMIIVLGFGNWLWDLGTGFAQFAGVELETRDVKTCNLSDAIMRFSKKGRL